MAAEIEAALRAPAVSELCRRFHVRRLDIFGSAAEGRFDPDRSDLDFLVSFEEPVTYDYADAYFGLLESLGALFGRKIDLITERSIENPYLRSEILAHRQLLYPPP